MGNDAHATVVERFEQDAQIDQLESFYEEAITMNGAAEPAKSKPIVRTGSAVCRGIAGKISSVAEFCLSSRAKRALVCAFEVVAEAACP